MLGARHVLQMVPLLCLIVHNGDNSCAQIRRINIWLIIDVSYIQRKSARNELFDNITNFATNLNGTTFPHLFNHTLSISMIHLRSEGFAPTSNGKIKMAFDRFRDTLAVTEMWLSNIEELLLEKTVEDTKSINDAFNHNYQTICLIISSGMYYPVDPSAHKAMSSLRNVHKVSCSVIIVKDKTFIGVIQNPDPLQDEFFDGNLEIDISDNPFLGQSLINFMNSMCWNVTRCQYDESYGDCVRQGMEHECKRSKTIHVVKYGKSCPDNGSKIVPCESEVCLTTTKRPLPDDITKPESNFAYMLGFTLGTVVALLMTILVIVTVVRRRQMKRRKKHDKLLKLQSAVRRSKGSVKSARAHSAKTFKSRGKKWSKSGKKSVSMIAQLPTPVKSPDTYVVIIPQSPVKDCKLHEKIFKTT